MSAFLPSFLNAVALFFATDVGLWFIALLGLCSIFCFLKFIVGR